MINSPGAAQELGENHCITIRTYGLPANCNNRRRRFASTDLRRRKYPPEGSRVTFSFFRSFLPSFLPSSERERREEPLGPIFLESGMHHVRRQNKTRCQENSDFVRTYTHHMNAAAQETSSEKGTYAESSSERRKFKFSPAGNGPHYYMQGILGLFSYLV